MALANIARPLNRNTPGYKPTEELPIAGSTKYSGTAQQILDNPDAFNAWLKQQPWYIETLRQWGQSPDNVHLSPDQRYRLLDAARRAGVDISNNKIGIDPQGNVEDTSTPTYAKVLMASTGILGGIGLLGAYGGGAALTGGAASSAAAPAATTGTLASSTIAPVAGTLPAVTASGTVPAAVGTGVTTGGTVAGTSGLVQGGIDTAGKTGIGSWLSSPYGSLISQGIGTFGQIYGANKAADASAEAARIQAESFDKALEAAKQEQDYAHGRDTLSDNQYADYLSRLNPYGQTGQSSNNRLSQFMGQPAGAQTPLTANPPPHPLPQRGPTVTQGPAPPFPQGTLEWPVYEGPDGTRRRVPPEKAAQVEAAGGKRVQIPAQGPNSFAQLMQ